MRRETIERDLQHNLGRAHRPFVRRFHALQSFQVAAHVEEQIGQARPDARHRQPETLTRGEDGLFRSIDGADAAPDANVRLASGVLESSNVNTADAMVNMIELARRFDLQVKAMRTAEENAATSAQLLRST